MIGSSLEDIRNLLNQVQNYYFRILIILLKICLCAENSTLLVEILTNLLKLQYILTWNLRSLKRFIIELNIVSIYISFERKWRISYSNDTVLNVKL